MYPALVKALVKGYDESVNINHKGGKMNANELKVGHRILYRESWSRQVKKGIVEKITPEGYVKISGLWLTEDQMNWLELTEDLGFVERRNQ